MYRALTVRFALACALGGCCLPLPLEEDDAPPPAAPQPAVAPTESAPSQPSPPAAPTEPAQPQVPDTELRARKIAEYSQSCLNRFSERAFSSRARYLRWVDPETGPTGRERRVNGVSTLVGRPSDCREAVTRAASMPPSMPQAEQAAAAYATAVERLQPLLERAERYYERESYRDDDMAQGQQMHGPLMEAFGAFEEADRDLRRHVEGVQDAVRAERIATMREDPSRRSRYLVERTIAQSLAVVRIARDLRIENNRYVHDEPQVLIAAVQTAQTGIDELIAHQPSPPDQAPDGLDSFERGAEEFLEAALACMRRVRDETVFTRGDRMNLGGGGEWMVDGSFGRLQRRYNELVDDYNRLR